MNKSKQINTFAKWFR